MKPKLLFILFCLITGINDSGEILYMLRPECWTTAPIVHNTMPISISSSSS